jgi:putative holliday junction resolvase
VKKVMGLDLGTRSCGIAISDTLGIAHPKEEFRFLEGAYRQCLAHLQELLKKEDIHEIALGYPLNMDGSAGESAKRSERFKEELLQMDPTLSVSLVDERLTTVMASRRLLEADISRGKRHAVIDQQAAQVILESYLNQKNGGSY